MAQDQIQSERLSKVPLLNQIPVQFGEIGKKKFEQLTRVQAELFDQVQDANKQWLDRAQKEINLGTEFVSNLSSARSIPEAMTAVQHLGACRLEMMMEDTRHFLSNTQKLMFAIARSANGGT
jgi:hypothetical protein